MQVELLEAKTEIGTTEYSPDGSACLGTPPGASLPRHRGQKRL